MIQWKHPFPVAVGTAGGGDARDVAEILARCGYHLGADLTPGLDNEWFTFLLARPSCVRDVGLFHWSVIESRLSLFARCMHGMKPGLAGLRPLLGSRVEWGRLGRNDWAAARAASMRETTPPDAAGWGWKEPNTHIYVYQLLRAFPDLRYVHVVYHGLDAAFAPEQPQMRLWGRHYDIDLVSPGRDARVEALRYWIRANRHASSMAAVTDPSRFHVLHGGKLRAEPRREIAALLDFMKPADAPPLDDLVALVGSPGAASPRRGQDLSIFPQDDLAVVKQTGFEIEER